MKSEKEKMAAGERYNAHSEEMIEVRRKLKPLLHKLNVTEYHTDKFRDVMNELFPNSHKSFYVEPPFYCDYGDLIYAEEGVFINMGAIILDGGTVTIGRKTLIAPGVHIYTAHHPVDADERDEWEDCKPIKIGERCWIGGHSTICPGVTIGDRCVIGAGSVVVKDIPDDCLAVGNPAKVIRKINQKEDRSKLMNG
ncbi:sugar O-acetyltransferase [Dysgonomonas macrotermitis]|uniref:Acetyltransferase n=1 Tax=Dysgonomonas macrotermitis TaxID=1346286 RepID=A0A1M4SG07_9BACT|nr:sugar O-acetyltransferase [Dysgonomonas macrotermitis]SHE31130.1 maltose O-acetyltransferase [Dysgonomonas macrotermitis]